MTENKMEIVAGKCPIEAGGNCPLRPQGEWIHKEFDPFLKEYGQCSNCLQRERVGNFCRNCGADMRGKKCKDCKWLGEKAVTGHCIKCRDKDMWEAKKND